MRGFQSNGSTREAVGLMKQLRVYALGSKHAPPAMQFLNGSRQAIDCLFPDNFHYFELLAMLVEEEAAELFDAQERAQMQAIGIEKGKAFEPGPRLRSLLAEAATVGGAIARANTFASPSTVAYYPKRQWQGVATGNDYTFTRDGIPQIDARNNVYYMAAGNSPAMMEKNVGKGSQYLWTYRDSKGESLEGGKRYRLHVPVNIPAQAFWSVVVYDVLSRSELQNGQGLPSVSSYSNPHINSDGTIDIDFGPENAGEAGNWIRTLPDRGWFPIFRFYSPAEPYFDKSWQLPDIERID